MQNLEKRLDSGAELVVSLASFEVGHRLFKCVARELESVNITVGGSAKSFKELSDLEINDSTVNTIKNVIARLVSSEGIDSVLWECMSWATYNKIKIVKENRVFESIEARGDFLIVAKEVLWFNLSPFFRNLGSLLPGRGPKT